MEYKEVITFWFATLEPAQWWIKDVALDARIRKQFSETQAQGARCELFGWRQHAAGRLAEIIVLDQFSRNMFRDSPMAFSCDALALMLAQEAIAQGADKALSPVQRSFCTCRLCTVNR